MHKSNSDNEHELKAKFQLMEDELNGAYENKDIKKISELLSDQWTILESSTGLSDKVHFITAIENGKLIQTKMKKKVQQVRLFDHCAIVVSRGKNEGRYSGIDYNSEQWITNVFIKEKSGWICVMTQEIPVSSELNKISKTGQ